MVVASGSLPAQAAYPGANGRIAFVRSGDGSDIFSVKPSGKRQREVVGQGSFVSAPVWAPSGRRLLYIAGGDTYDTELMVVRRNGEKMRKVVEIPGGVQDASWSPNGKRIVFSLARSSDQGDIYIVDSDGGDLVRISAGRATEHSVAWSPDGGRIAFVSDTGGAADILTMSTSGSQRRRVTQDVTLCERGCGDRYGGISGLDWAPGGRRLVYAADRGDGGSYIHTIRRDGTHSARVTEGMYPSWSPNGKRIAFVAPAPNSFSVFTVRVNGTRRYRVTSPPRLVEDFDPDWGVRPTAR
jgi:TolB protein